MDVFAGVARLLLFFDHVVAEDRAALDFGRLELRQFAMRWCCRPSSQAPSCGGGPSPGFSEFGAIPAELWSEGRVFDQEFPARVGPRVAQRVVFHDVH